MKNWSMTVLALVSVASPAWAMKDELEVQLGEPVATWVTGNGLTKNVAWPYGSAAMTPRWIVAVASLRWSCSDGIAKSLKVATDQGPNKTPLTIDLTDHKLWGGTTPDVELYLWQVEAVKKACVTDGAVKVNSLTVSMELSCPKGVFQKTQVIPLEVSCEITKPSDAAISGISGSQTSRQTGPGMFQSVMRFGGYAPGASALGLTVGTQQRIEFSPVLLRVWKPTIRKLTPVRLDAAGKVIERFSPCTFENPQDPRCRANIELTVKEPGAVRLALEATYLDDATLLSAVSELTARTPAQVASAAKNEMSFEERSEGMNAFAAFVQGLTDPAPAAVDAALKDFVAKHPAFVTAGYNGHNFWANFKDGRPLMVDHTIAWKPKVQVKSPPAWEAAMRSGWEASFRGDDKAAATAFEKAVAEAEKLGPDDAHVAASLHPLAMSLRHQGLLSKSVPHYRRALAIEEKVLTPNHAKVVETMLDLALMEGQSNPAEQDRLLTEALKRAEAITPAAIETQHQVLAALAGARVRQHKEAEARAFGRRADALRAQAAKSGLEYEGPVEPDLISYLERVAMPEQRMK